MKFSAFLAGALLWVPFLSGAGEPNYTLDVKMKNVPDSVVFTLGCDDDPKYKQKVKIVNDSLHFELDIQEEFPINFYLTGRNPADKQDRYIISFYGGRNISQKVRNKADGFAVDSEITGAAWDEAIAEWQRVNRDYSNTMKALREERARLMPQGQAESGAPVRLDSVTGSKVSAIGKKMQAKGNEFEATMKEWIMSHPDVPKAVSLMTWRYAKFSREELEAFGAKVPAGMMEMPAGQMLKKRLDTKIIAVGDKLADYDLAGVDADSVGIRLSQFSTPYILVDFNSLGCGACRMAAKQEIPKIVETYAGELTFVSYSVDEERKRMLRAHELDNATWPAIWNGSGSQGMDCIRYGVTGYPTFFLFGPDRTLLETFVGWGPNLLGKKLEPYIGH